ncbi:EF-hand domain-containing protein [Streptomyces meridianus]|uniref:EF-hand domain-containing protein n=1 Tax=Streptomyces meridianus TaxID=2938945 RepID=A0ABT0X3J0_9ACTN|nr:EF-hand domain-containing protein [Streptomyces meridianus]MCM2576785.1 EF-hand domain-containing protein [Streptomyces meridianus]
MDKAESAAGESYDRKVAERFATFDQDGNGYISREDFKGAAAAVLREFGTAARSVEGQALYEGAEAFWQGMAGIADRDGDQRITREEFTTQALKRLRDDSMKFAEIARPFLHAVLDVAAEERNGKLATDRAERVLRVLGVKPEMCGKVASALDGDADGMISEEEIITAFAGYYTTSEPKD